MSDHPSNGKISDFNGIRFSGETINNIVGDYEIECEDIFSEKLLLNGIQCNLMIQKYITEQHRQFSKEKHVLAAIDLDFSEPIKTNNILSFYHIIDSVCKFMTFRENSYITKFELTKPNQIHKEINTEFATCYIKPINTNDPDYHSFEIISLKDMKKESIRSLFEIFDIQNKVKPYLNFFPKDKDDSNYINIVRVKEICAALECELSYIDSSGFTDPILDELKKQVKKVISTHRKSETPLQNYKTYDRILGDMKHWSLSLSDKIYNVYEVYVFILINFGCNKDCDIMLHKEDIEAFVNLRNRNSHGTFESITSKMAKVSFIMYGLTYCCILKRIGLEDVEIENIMKRIMI